MGLWTRIKMFFKVRTNRVLDEAEDPRDVMDYAYNQQMEFLRKVKQGLLEVATAKHQLNYQLQRQQNQIPHLEAQASKAIEADREDLARLALQRKQIVLVETAGIQQQLAEVAEEERKLIAAEQEIASRIEQFRTHREVMSARYSAAEAQVNLKESLTGVSGDLGELSMALGRAEEKTHRMIARAAALDTLIEVGSLEPAIGNADIIEVELQKLSSKNAVEEELALLKSGLIVEAIPEFVE